MVSTHNDAFVAPVALTETTTARLMQMAKFDKAITFEPVSSKNFSTLMQAEYFESKKHIETIDAIKNLAS